MKSGIIKIEETFKPFEHHVHTVLKNSTIGPTTSLFQHLEYRYSLRRTQATVDHDYCEESYCQERVNCNYETKMDLLPDHLYRWIDCQATYIGETGRNLNTRLTEHRRATRNGDINNHIAEHHLQTNHRIDWDSATCVTYNTNYYQRIILESWFTNLEQTPINRCLQLPVPYKRLIDDINRQTTH